MSTNHEAYYYLSDMLGSYFHQDCGIFGDTNEEIVAEYIKTSWPYERLGLRADIQRFLHMHPGDSFDAMTTLFSMGAYPEPDNQSMASWLREVVVKLKATDGE